MLPLSKDLQIKLNKFVTADGKDTLESLATALWEYYSNECTTSEGNEVYRNQGAAQLAQWLKLLPKGLRDASDVTQ